MSEELKNKVKFLFGMVKLNDGYYHDQIPDFEIKYLLKLGVEQEYIDSQLIEFQLSVRETNL